MEKEKKYWPKTVSEAAQYVVNNMLKEDIEWVRNEVLEPSGMIVVHHTIGRDIRNEFGLWETNEDLKKDCGYEHPDDCSHVILEKIWELIHNNGVD